MFVDRPFRLASRERAAFRAGAPYGHWWCHLWCAPGDEAALHTLAVRIGLRREWFQAKPGFPHYDLVPPRRAAALRGGAEERDLAEWLRARRDAASGPAQVQ